MLPALPRSKISITILAEINELLEKISKETNTSKSSLVEEALQKFFVYKLDQDMRVIAQLKFDDVPNEDEWLHLQSNI